METKFTKGEWYIAGYAGEHDEHGASIKSGDDFICSTSSLRNGNWGEYFANAKLVAAAPKLFECLIAMTDCIIGADSVGHTIIRIPLELSQKIGETLREATE